MRTKSLKLIVGILALFGFISSAQATVSLSLVPSAPNIAAGNQFTVDMKLSNPSSEQLGALNVFLTFNSAYLQAVDNDTGNWITTGINVLDGPYHSNFNWDSHIQNIADNANGTISYGEASLYSNVFGDDTFAQITFLAKTPVLSTPINYVITGTHGFNDTYVYDIDAANILGATSGTTVNVVPEPGSIILLGSGIFGLFGFVRKRRDK